MESFGRVPVKPRSVNPNSAVVRACGESSIAFLPGLLQECYVFTLTWNKVFGDPSFVCVCVCVAAGLCFTANIFF